jgi:hypothetical protein
MDPRYEIHSSHHDTQKIVYTTYHLNSQIFPTAVRARGLSFAASGGAIGSIIVAQIWPVGIANLGSKIYFFFMAINLVCVPIIYLLYPETKGRPLEDMDVLFGGSPGSSTENLLAGQHDGDRDQSQR